MNGFSEESLSWWPYTCFHLYSLVAGELCLTPETPLFSPGMDSDFSCLSGANHWLPQPRQADQRLADEWSKGKPSWLIVSRAGTLKEGRGIAQPSLGWAWAPRVCTPGTGRPLAEASSALWARPWLCLTALWSKQGVTEWAPRCLC